MSFLEEVQRLIEEQGREDFVRQALDELGIPFVDDVMDRIYFLKRCKALEEENR